MHGPKGIDLGDLARRRRERAAQEHADLVQAEQDALISFALAWKAFLEEPIPDDVEEVRIPAELAQTGSTVLVVKRRLAAEEQIVGGAQ